MNENKLRQVLSLLFAATMWGIIWYPYRLLQAAGVGGEMSTFVTYALALVATSLIFPGAWREARRAPGVLLLVALAAGWCNLSYVLGMLQGEVVRVLLLFYLAPLWTVPLARLILGEHIPRMGYAVVLLAFCGALVMLWNPARGLPVPSSGAEWLGLSSGFSFALANVMVRRAQNCGVVMKTLSVFSGVVVVSLAALLIGPGGLPAVSGKLIGSAPLALLIAAMLVTMSLAVQYGLSQVPATRAIVILLFELVVAAVAAYFLSNELITVQEWIGGAMIIAGSLFSGQIEHRVPERAPMPG